MFSSEKMQDNILGLLMLTGLLLFSQPKKMKAEDETAITKQIWLFWDMGTSIEAWALVTGSI